MPSDTERYSTSFYNLVRPAWHQRQAMACLFIRTHALRISVSNLNVLVPRHLLPKTKDEAPLLLVCSCSCCCCFCYHLALHVFAPPPASTSLPFLLHAKKIILLFAHLAGPGLGNKNSRSGWAQPGPVPPVDDDDLHPILVVESSLFTGTCSLYQGCERRRPATMSICLKRQTTQTHTRCFTAGYLENTRVRGS